MDEGVEVMTADVAAEFIRASTKTSLVLARDGTLPGEKVGQAWRFLRSNLLDHISGRNKVKAT